MKMQQYSVMQVFIEREKMTGIEMCTVNMFLNLPNINFD